MPMVVVFYLLATMVRLRILAEALMASGIRLATYIRVSLVVADMPHYSAILMVRLLSG